MSYQAPRYCKTCVDHETGMARVIPGGAEFCDYCYQATSARLYDARIPRQSSKKEVIPMPLPYMHQHYPKCLFQADPADANGYATVAVRNETEHAALGPGWFESPDEALDAARCPGPIVTLDSGATYHCDTCKVELVRGTEASKAHAGLPVEDRTQTTSEILAALINASPARSVVAPALIEKAGEKYALEEIIEHADGGDVTIQPDGTATIDPPKPHFNSKCPCGSDKRFGQCCGKK